jgi:hypothetical protein
MILGWPGTSAAPTCGWSTGGRTSTPCRCCPTCCPGSGSAEPPGSTGPPGSPGPRRSGYAVCRNPFRRAGVSRAVAATGTIVGSSAARGTRLPGPRRENGRSQRDKGRAAYCPPGPASPILGHGPDDGRGAIVRRTQHQHPYLTYHQNQAAPVPLWHPARGRRDRARTLPNDTDAPPITRTCDSRRGRFVSAGPRSTLSARMDALIRRKHIPHDAGREVRG